MIKKIILGNLFFLFLIQYTFNQTIRENISVNNVNSPLFNKDSIGKIPVDPNDTSYQQILINDFSFLISNSEYYDFKVLKIIEFKMGYGLFLRTKINDRYSYALSITMKEGKSKHKKIKKWHTYRMKLTRYYRKPLARSIEYPPIYDVMLGQNNVGILSIGYSYIFISQNTKGLFYVDSIEVAGIERTISNNTNEISSFSKNFIKSISFEEDSALLMKYIDTTSVKTSLKNYSTRWGPNMIHGIIKKIPTQVPSFEWANFKIDTNSFSPFFWGLLKEFYSLPKNHTNNLSFLEKDIAIDILYLSDEIYTIRVIWKLPSVKVPYTAFLAVKKIDEIYKVIGFNVVL
jgi:hypothetical protein